MSKILVIDDEIEICELLQVALEMHGHKVVLSQSATHAIKLMEGQEFDFVIIDMIMPEISGLEMIRIINDRYPKTLTILTTGLQTQDVIIEALKQGAYNFVNKPFSLDEINNIISAGSRAKICHTQAKSIQPYLTQELHFVLPSRKCLMEEVAGTIAGLANWLGFPEKLVAMNIPLTVDELFLNAVMHGNKEDESKTVSIKVDLNDEEIGITITDQGEGFDWHRVLDRNTPADLENEGGRGIFLVKHYVDSIHYNQTGNEVRVTIRRDRVAPHSKFGKGNRTQYADSDVERIIAIDDCDQKDD
jgi:serine/threonine-protein kinase RsbW